MKKALTKVAMRMAQEALRDLQARLSVTLEPTPTGGWKLEVVLAPRA